MWVSAGKDGRMAFLTVNTSSKGVKAGIYRLFLKEKEVVSLLYVLDMYSEF